MRKSQIDSENIAKFNNLLREQNLKFCRGENSAKFVNRPHEKKL